MSSNASLDILTSSSLQQPCNSVEIKKFKLESIIEIQYNHVCKLTVDIITACRYSYNSWSILCAAN